MRATQRVSLEMHQARSSSVDQINQIFPDVAFCCEVVMLDARGFTINYNRGPNEVKQIARAVFLFFFYERTIASFDLNENKTLQKSTRRTGERLANWFTSLPGFQASAA